MAEELQKYVVKVHVEITGNRSYFQPGERLDCHFASTCCGPLFDMLSSIDMFLQV
jgi:hypothetical protein